MRDWGGKGLGKDNDLLCILFYYINFFLFLFLVFYMVFVWRREAGGSRRERGVIIWLTEEGKKARVSLLLVTPPTQRAQPALGQYLITCTAEQHAISTY